MNIKDIVIAKELDLVTIDVRTNPDKLRKYISKDFLEIGASSKQSNYEEVIEILSNNLEWEADLADFKFREISSNVVQLIFNATIRHSHQSEPIMSVRSSIWKYEDNDWKMIFHQGTKVTP